MGRVGGGDPVKVIDVCGKRATADCFATRGSVWGGRGSESNWWAKRCRQVKTSVSLNICCVAALAPAESEMDFLRGGVTACDLVGTFSPLRLVDNQPLSI